MRRYASALGTAGLAAVLEILGVPHPALSGDPVPRPVEAYNPYPSGILPSDLDVEIARVQREVQFIFNEAFNEWRALPLPTMSGNPPTLQGDHIGSPGPCGRDMGPSSTRVDGVKP